MSSSGISNTASPALCRTGSIKHVPTPHPDKKRYADAIADTIVDAIVDAAGFSNSAGSSEDPNPLKRVTRSCVSEISIESEGATETEGATEAKVCKAVRNVGFSDKTTLTRYPTENGSSQSMEIEVCDLNKTERAGGRKTRVSHILSEKKPTQNRDHFVEEKRSIETFLRDKIPLATTWTKEKKKELDQIILLLQERGNNTEGFKELIEGDEVLWKAFQDNVLSRIEWPEIIDSVTELFTTEPGRQLVKTLLGKLYRYHFSSREDFKKEFHE